MSLIRMSASSLKKGDLCPRRLAFDKIEGLPDPSGEAAEYGTLIHEMMEKWVRDSDMPGNRHCIELMKHCPPPGKAWVEHEFGFHDETFEVHWRGFIDAMAAYTDGKMHLGEADTCILIDYKTTSDHSKYALTESDGILVDSEGKPDVQSTLYAHWAFTIAGFKNVVWRWCYVQTKGANTSKRVEVVANREHVARVYEGMAARARGYVELLTIRPKANTVPFRPSACFAFRKPCPYTSACVRAQGVFAQDPLDLDSGAITMTDFLKSIAGSFPVESDDAPPPPPPEDDDQLTEAECLAIPCSTSVSLGLGADSEPPPPPPEDEDHEAQQLVDDYMAANRKPSIALGKPEAGFINAPEAAALAKAPATPAEAVEIFGAEPVKEPKPKASKKGRKVAKDRTDVCIDSVCEPTASNIVDRSGIIGHEEGQREFINASPADALRPNDRHGQVEAKPTDREKVFQAFVETTTRENRIADQVVADFDADERIRRIIREELRAYFSR